MEDGPYELVVMVFGGSPGSAAEALAALKQLEKGGLLRLFNSAVLVKDAHGVASIQETEDVPRGRGALFGALVGGLVGLLGGPAGAIIGAAAGAAAGGLAAGQIDLGFADSFLKELKDSLLPDSSALLVIVEQRWVERLAVELERFNGKLLLHAVRSELAERFKEDRG